MTEPDDEPPIEPVAADRSRSKLPPLKLRSRRRVLLPELPDFRRERPVATPVAVPAELHPDRDLMAPQASSDRAEPDQLEEPVHLSIAEEPEAEREAEDFQPVAILPDLASGEITVLPDLDVSADPGAPAEGPSFVAASTVDVLPPSRRQRKRAERDERKRAEDQAKAEAVQAKADAKAEAQRAKAARKQKAEEPPKPAKPPKAEKPAKPSRAEKRKPREQHVEVAAAEADDLAEKAERRPVYSRLLRLRHVQPNGWLRALYLEGAIGLAVVLVLAEAASIWTIIALPVVVAVLVKANDILVGSLHAGPASDPEPVDEETGTDELART